MMVEVADVVDQDEAKGKALVVVKPDVGEGRGVGVLDGMGEVTVEREPEGDDFGPGIRSKRCRRTQSFCW